MRDLLFTPHTHTQEKSNASQPRLLCLKNTKNMTLTAKGCKSKSNRAGRADEV
jgi:hypothetical protein